MKNPVCQNQSCHQARLIKLPHQPTEEHGDMWRCHICHRIYDYTKDLEKPTRELSDQEKRVGMSLTPDQLES